jgi:hypothetical protein
VYQPYYTILKPLYIQGGLAIVPRQKGDMETFKRRRETEIKHGRVAMYATTGSLELISRGKQWKSQGTYMGRYGKYGVSKQQCFLGIEWGYRSISTYYNIMIC